MISVFDDVLPEFMLDGIHEEIKRKGWQHGWHSNSQQEYKHFNIRWCPGDKQKRVDNSAQLPSNIGVVWEYLKDSIMRPTPHLLRCYSNGNTYGSEGYPHTDSKIPTDVTAILYLNKEWNMSWGGTTNFFENGRMIDSVMPRCNRLARFPANTWHQSGPMTKWCNEFRQILVFKATCVEDGINRDDLYIKYGIEHEQTFYNEAN